MISQLVNLSPMDTFSLQRVEEAFRTIIVIAAAPLHSC